MNSFRISTLAAIILALVCVAHARPQYQECTSAITANFNGTPTIPFRAWDQTSGSNGGTARNDNPPSAGTGNGAALRGPA